LARQAFCPTERLAFEQHAIACLLQAEALGSRMARLSGAFCQSSDWQPVLPNTYA
jgi:hypothetical protein